MIQTTSTTDFASHNGPVLIAVRHRGSNRSVYDDLMLQYDKVRANERAVVMSRVALDAAVENLVNDEAAPVPPNASEEVPVEDVVAELHAKLLPFRLPMAGAVT